MQIHWYILLLIQDRIKKFTKQIAGKTILEFTPIDLLTMKEEVCGMQQRKLWMRYCGKWDKINVLLSAGHK